MYLEIDEGFPEHPKTLQLCASMENPTAFAYLFNLWKWACRCCKDGDLRGMNAYAIEEAARYHQHDGRLFKALAAKLGDRAGFIDVDDQGNPAHIHNWEKRTGAALKRMEDEAELKRAFRAHKAGKCSHGCKWCATSTKRQGDVVATSGGRPLDVVEETPGRLTQTSPDKTSPDPDREEESLPPGARDPGTADPEPVPPAPGPRPGPVVRMAGHQLVKLFGRIRNEVFPHTLPWHTARDTRGDAGSFAAMLADDEVDDVEPTMRLALEHIRDGVAGWNREQHAKDPSFAFGAWKSGFHGLREELHGRGPPVADPKASARAKSDEVLANWRPRNEREKTEIGNG